MMTDSLTQVNILFQLCPQEDDRGIFRLDQRSQEAVVALGIYLLESKLHHQDCILPYLLRLLGGMPKAEWPDEIRSCHNESKYISCLYFKIKTCIYFGIYCQINCYVIITLLLPSGVPVSERFSFCLNTLLTDVATKCENSRGKIIAAQVQLLHALINQCIAWKGKSETSTSSSKCKYFSRKLF